MHRPEFPHAWVDSTYWQEGRSNTERYLTVLRDSVSHRIIREQQALIYPLCFSRGRAATPTLSFEELARRLAEEWEKLPEEDRAVYRQRSDEELLRHETMDAAMVLTQVDRRGAFPVDASSMFTFE